MSSLSFAERTPPQCLSLFRTNQQVDYEPGSNAKVCRVEEIWEGSKGSSIKAILKVHLFKQIAGLHPFYGMKEIQETNQKSWIIPKVCLFFSL